MRGGSGDRRGSGGGINAALQARPLKLARYERRPAIHDFRAVRCKDVDGAPARTMTREVPLGYLVPPVASHPPGARRHAATAM